MDYVYYQLEDAADVSRFIIETPDRVGLPGRGFSFFRGLGVTDYEKTFKMWLREFPRPIFIIAAKGKVMVGWVYVEAWGEPAYDGEPVYVLRAIEVLPSLRGRRLGAKLTILGASLVVGYLLVKPLTPQAERFFKRLGFMEPSEFRRCPIDLSHHYGYLILPPFRRKKLLEKMENYFRTKEPHIT